MSVPIYIPGYSAHPLASQNAKGRHITEGYRRSFYLAFKRAKLMSSKLFRSETSDARSFVDFQTVGLGMAQVRNEMEETPFDSITDGDAMETGWLIYKLGYMISREALDDERYGVFKKTSKRLPDSFLNRREANCAATWSGTFTTTIGFDPVSSGSIPICSTSHNLGRPNQVTGATTWSNKAATPSAIGYESLKSAHQSLHDTPDLEGFPTNYNGTALILPSAQEAKAIETTKTMTKPYSNDNTRNVVAQDWRTEIIVWKWLTSTLSWWMVDKSEVDAAWVTRNKPEFHDDSDYDKGILKFYGYSRGNSYIHEPRGIYGNQGA